jgi:hypothetical protein
MAAALKIPVTSQSLRFGYIYWPAALDDSVRDFFGDRKTVNVSFLDSFLGEKRLDYKYRRISIGPRKIQSVPPTATTFRLTFRNDGRLDIACP